MANLIRRAPTTESYDVYRDNQGVWFELCDTSLRRRVRPSWALAKETRHRPASRERAVRPEDYAPGGRLNRHNEVPQLFHGRRMGRVTEDYDVFRDNAGIWWEVIDTDIDVPRAQPSWAIETKRRARPASLEYLERCYGRQPLTPAPIPRRERPGGPPPLQLTWTTQMRWTLNYLITDITFESIDLDSNTGNRNRWEIFRKIFRKEYVAAGFGADSFEQFKQLLAGQNLERSCVSENWRLALADPCMLSWRNVVRRMEWKQRVVTVRAELGIP